MIPLVSIIIPLYNHENYIIEALESCIAQTYDKTEIVIIDDASKDRSYDVVAGYLSSYTGKTKIRLSRNKQNLGSAATINRGVSMARGKLINILNSDDCFMPTRIQKLAKRYEAKSGPYFCGFTGVEYIFERSALEFDDLPLLIIKNRFDQFPSLSWGFRYSNYAVSTGNWMFSRDLYDAIGGFPDMRYCLDWYFAVRCCQFVEPEYIDEPLYGYRIHGRNSFRSLHDLGDGEAQAVQNLFHASANLIINPMFPNIRHPISQNDALQQVI